MSTVARQCQHRRAAFIESGCHSTIKIRKEDSSTMADIVRVLLALMPLLLWYLYTEAKRQRFKKYAHIPHLTPSLVLGHMKTIGDFYKTGDKRRHIGEYAYCPPSPLTPRKSSCKDTRKPDVSPIGRLCALPDCQSRWQSSYTFNGYPARVICSLCCAFA